MRSVSYSLLITLVNHILIFFRIYNPDWRSYCCSVGTSVGDFGNRATGGSNSNSSTGSSIILLSKDFREIYSF